MAGPTRFDPATLSRLERVRDVRLETAALDGSRRHRTIIWIVTAADEAFIRSVRGAKGRWYREVLAEPEVILHVESEAIPGIAVPATDAESIQRVSDAFSAKYGWLSRGSTASMLRPHARDDPARGAARLGGDVPPFDFQAGAACSSIGAVAG